jgi:hypothetical protein
MGSSNPLSQPPKYLGLKVKFTVPG